MWLLHYSVPLMLFSLFSDAPKADDDTRRMASSHCMFHAAASRHNKGRRKGKQCLLEGLDAMAWHPHTCALQAAVLVLRLGCLAGPVLSRAPRLWIRTQSHFTRPVQYCVSSDMRSTHVFASRLGCLA